MDLKDQVLDVSVQVLNFLFVFKLGWDRGQQGLVQLETIRDVLQASLLIEIQEESRVSSRLSLPTLLWCNGCFLQGKTVAAYQCAVIRRDCEHRSWGDANAERHRLQFGILRRVQLGETLGAAQSDEKLEKSAKSEFHHR